MKLNTTQQKVILGIFIACLLLLLWNYHMGYDNSISWSVTTTSEAQEFPAWTMNNGLMEHQIMGEKYLLKERYSGGKIERNIFKDQVYIGLCWIGLCAFLALSTTFSRYLFFGVMAGLALFINRLNLFEIGFFGMESKMVMAIPFLLFLAPLVYFHEYRKNTPFLIQIAVLLIVSLILSFGIQNVTVFTDHFLAHSLFGFTIVSLLFIFIIAEEIIFLFLYAVTSTKGGKSNHFHFVLLSLIYLGNLTLYYLNKSGLYENSFFFFDPFILLTVTILVTLWSIQYKDQVSSKYVPTKLLVAVIASLGIIACSFLSLSMQRGVETIHQAFHYFILYAHLGFGFLFFLYIIANFLDPLIKGFQVHKIVYRERNFPYATARIGGVVVMLAFFFLSGQEAYNLLRSGYYSYLSMKEKNMGNELLSKEYIINAEFLGFNAHFPNYLLAWEEWDNGNEFRAKTNFFNATQRYPSSYAWVNYGNLESQSNPNKVQALYEESLRKMESSEMKNNLGVIHLDKKETAKALDYFQIINSSDDWNDAPLINKWNALNQLGTTDSTSIEKDYNQGNYGVKANILSAVQPSPALDFEFENISNAAPLHRHAYLVNSTHAFKHDSVESYIRKQIEESVNGATNSALANALAIHLYKKGEVNKAFRLYDELQANTNEVYKGKYLDALGKLSVDQGAYKLAEDFFTEAVRAGHETSRISRLEAFAGQGKNETIAEELLRILEIDPGLTTEANTFLTNIESYKPRKQQNKKYVLDSVDTQEIIYQASKNAFDESLIIDSIEELNRRDSLTSSYQILVEATEINPYSTSLLKNYILSALEWNLNDYADQSLVKLKGLVSDDEFQAFEETVETRREELLEEEW